MRSLTGSALACLVVAAVVSGCGVDTQTSAVPGPVQVQGNAGTSWAVGNTGTVSFANYTFGISGGTIVGSAGTIVMNVGSAANLDPNLTVSQFTSQGSDEFSLIAYPFDRIQDGGVGLITCIQDICSGNLIPNNPYAPSGSAFTITGMTLTEQ